MPETYYDRLGVARDATTDEIRAAFRERLKETHPDVNDASDAGEATKTLIAARDVLTDPDERARYDDLGHESYVDGADDNDGRADPTDADADSSGGDTTSDGDEGSWNGGSVGGRNVSWGDASAGDRADATESSWHDTRRAQGATDSGPGWSRRDGDRQPWEGDRSYSVGDGGGSVLRKVPRGNSLVLLVSTFLVYPVLLWGTFVEAFPLAVNALVGVCTVLLVAFLQSMPGVGVIVFGTWSVLTPLLLVGFRLEPTGLLGAGLVLGTVLPLGFSLLTRSVLRH